MTKLEKSIEIEASPEKVFALLIDVDKQNEINKGFLEIERTSKGPVGVGSTHHYVAASGGNQGEWDMEVTEFIKNKKIAERTIGHSKLKAVTIWNLEPTAKGTKVTHSMDYELPYSILGKIVDKLKLSKDLDKSMTKAGEDMKKALET